MLHETSIAAVTIFATFVLGVIGLSFFLGRKGQSASGYYAAHGQIHWFVNGIAFAGDYLSAASFLGICGMIAFSGYDGFLYSIGFLAGWRTGPGQSLGAGLEGALVATLFAFIPSFAMVLPLAPFVSRIRAGSRLGLAMTAIGAVVVAAILLLGFGLAQAAWLPGGVPAALPIIVTIVSGIAIARGWASTPLVVLAAAAVGIVAHVLVLGVS